MTSLKEQPIVDEYTNRHLQQASVFIKHRFTDERYFRMNFHSHHGHELYFLHEGTGNYVNEGHIYPFAGNDLILAAAHDIHKAAPIENERYSRTVVNFLPQCLSPGSQKKFLDMFGPAYSAHRKHMRLEPGRHASIFRLLERMNEEYKGKQTGYKQALNIYVDRLLEQIYPIFHAGTERLERPAHAGNAIVEGVMNYLTERYAAQVSLDELAKAFYITPHYLCRLFKKTTGETISEFVLYTRIHQAKHELMTTDAPIAEIAGKVGFNNYSYFGVVFKRHELLTPNEYRKQFRQS